LKFEKYIRNQ
jgi:hypothetical protein